MYDYTSEPTARAVMQELLAAYPALLSRHELQRELGDPLGVEDALDYCQRMGLVHVIDDYVWATRSAVAAEELVT